MSAVDFQVVVDEKIDESNMKRGFIKLYHQSGSIVDNENSNNQLFFVENHNCIQSGNGYLEFDIKFKKHDNNNFSITAPGHDVIRLVNNAFACTLYDAGLSISSGVEIQQNKFVGPGSTILKLVTQKDGGIITFR